AIGREIEAAAHHDRRSALDDLLVPPVGVRPGDPLHHALLVLEHERGVALALLAVAQADGVDDAAQADARSALGASRPGGRRGQLGALRAERAHRDVGEAAQVGLVAIEGMAGDEEAQRLALARELVVRRPRLDVRRRGRRRVWQAGAPREETQLRAGALLRARARPAEGVVEGRPQPGAVALDRVERAARDQALDHAPVHLLRAHPQAELVQAGERAVGTGGQDGLDGLRADAL